MSHRRDTPTEDDGSPVPLDGTLPGPPDPISWAGPFLAPPQAPDEVGRLGPYRVLGLIGRGGMGEVFRAEDTRLGRPVALKVLLPELVADPVANARFRREARAQAAVSHDHIVPVYEVEEANGVAYIAMPLLKGRTLAAALESSPAVPIHEVVRVGREVALALAAAHAAGLIHRDIKPANIWLEEVSGSAFGRVKVLDFGLARSAAGATDGTILTGAGAIMGTPAYMSPEQARSRPVDHRTDLFSLGAVLYQMATGHRPFIGASPFDMMQAVVTHDPAPVANVPPALRTLIARLLAKDPADRPPTAAAVATELARIERELTAPLPLDDTRSFHSVETRDKPRRKWLQFGAALAAGALLVGMLVTQPWKQKPEGDTSGTAGTPPGLASPAPMYSDREAAERILSFGGAVKIRHREEDLEIVASAGLPPGEWVLIHFTAMQSPNITDTELSRFASCVNLTAINLNGTKVTDAGLIHLKGVTKLEYLDIGNTGIGDAVFAACEGFPDLIFLDVRNTRVTEPAARAFSAKRPRCRVEWAGGTLGPTDP